MHSSSVSFVLLMNIGMERGGAQGKKKKKKILVRQHAGYALQRVASRSARIPFTLQQDGYSVVSMKMPLSVPAHHFLICGSRAK